METRNLIDNEWIKAAETLEVTNPATDEVIGEVPSVSADEVHAAVSAAEAAFPAFSARTAADRSAMLRRLARSMRRDIDRLAAIMTAEQGKPLAESRGEIEYAASFIAFAAGEGERLYGDIVPASATGKRILAIRQPVGVCAIITPWNFPAAMITRKLGPALAAGCCCVIKPASATPLSAIAIGALALEAGFPPGAINIITGSATVIGEALLNDQRLRKLSFTGSTEVGRELMRHAADNLLRLSLELGGHAPLIVFDDADLEHAVAETIACKFRNGGQTCVSANRIYVQAGIYDAFMPRFKAAIEKLKVGEGTAEGVQIGPMIDDDAVAKVERHVEDAAHLGGHVRVGGKRIRIDGLADRFCAPTLIEGMTPEMLCAREETFGPLAPVARFEAEDEGVALANDSEYGLAAYFFTRDYARLTRVAEALQFGIVGANDGRPSTAQAPFGGVKQSGFGREGGRYVMNEYTDWKYISLGGM
jgi:succinate-semialdehyde dehydrogenase/glutarate-semialdehyde dehydrogenase